MKSKLNAVGIGEVDMKIVLAIHATLFVLLAAVFIIIASPRPIVSAQGVFDIILDDSSGQRGSTQQNNDDSKASTFEYTAQPGDSYTLIARKTVQVFDEKHDMGLSNAQIIYVETHLTQEAGSPELSVGEEVTIDERNVQQWVEQALSLSDAEEGEWGYYAAAADFDTSSVDVSN